MEYVRNLAQQAGFRIPDINRLWRQNDQVDSEQTVEDKRNFFERYESYLIRIQEICLWTDFVKSLTVLLSFNVIYFFVPIFSGTVINTTAWAIIMGFVFTTWRYRIWPEIRVEVPESERPDKEDFTHVHPDCLNAPEMTQKWNQFKIMLTDKYSALLKLREDQPLKFCLFASLTFCILAYLLRDVSIMNFIYYCVVGMLTLPVLSKHPAVQCFRQMVLNPNEDSGENKEQKQEYKLAKKEMPKESKEEVSFDLTKEISSERQFLPTLARDSTADSGPVSQFVCGLASIPSPDDLDEEDMKEGSPDDEDANFLPTSESIPSVEDDLDVKGSDGEQDSQVFDLPVPASKDRTIDTLSDSSSSEGDTKDPVDPQSVMLRSALKEEVHTITEEARRSTSSEEEFEIIDEDEFKNADLH